MTGLLTRRHMLIGAALAAPPLILAATGHLPSLKQIKRAYLGTGERLSYAVHSSIGRTALAREYAPEDISPAFRTNGATEANSPNWMIAQETNFASWSLKLDGLFHAPRQFSLPELRAMPVRRQITRHDCVEGWSAIGGWAGVPFGALLKAVQLKADARYIVFWCGDVFRGWQYYESIDLIDAFHPQTILAYNMSGAPLPIGHGAPLRLRVERQLGYKHAKFVERIEAVASLDGIGQGRGGFWEDVSNYEWYDGI